MAKYCLVVFMTFVTIACVPGHASSHSEAKGDVYLLLTEGIVGGFVPAHVRLRIVVVPGKDDYRVAWKSHSNPGAEPVYKEGKISEAGLSELVDQLGKMGLWKLPTESPEGSEDIYRLDTSLAIRAGGQLWRNGGPSGCVHGNSKVKADEEQRQQFKKIVALVENYFEERATKSSDAETFSNALREVMRNHNSN